MFTIMGCFACKDMNFAHIAQTFSKIIMKNGLKITFSSVFQRKSVILQQPKYVYMDYRHLFSAIRRATLLLAGCLCAGEARAQDAVLTPEVRTAIEQMIDQEASRHCTIGPVHIDSVSATGKTLELYAGINCSYIPLREENVDRIYSSIRQMLPAHLQGRNVKLFTNGRLIEELIPLATRKKQDRRVPRFAPECPIPLVTALQQPHVPTKGLRGRHIALWQSHGYYYEKSLDRWEWQRARIFQTVEDLFTQSYVLPYLVPMLERAGGYVMLPRERDVNDYEVIVDNDGCSWPKARYAEVQGDKAWTSAEGEGFAHPAAALDYGQNPFKDGTCRQTRTVSKGQESIITWTPSVPHTGRYAVYVSYKTLPKSTREACYTVSHLGGHTTFHVNQQMGGSTWIYLGSFTFEKDNPAHGIRLTNRTSHAGDIVTADAVKIGGGMGNIRRGTGPQQQVSGYPRWTEGARYWLQWAGMPDSIYSPTHNENDYVDDYRCRGEWVNHLAGGSEVCPDRDGLHIPLDLSLAFHSDAGTRKTDYIIGTLGIYCTLSEGQVTFADGTTRYLNHDLCDLVVSQITDDIRALYEPNWTRRGMWNQAYFEARVPRVPAMLLELLSHQNFADMRYGIDPRFRFSVSRAIYKGILRFIASQRRQEAVVAPLPPRHLALNLTEEGHARLTWQPVTDPLEPSAEATGYIVYTRIGGQDFDNGRYVEGTSFETALTPCVPCSFRVEAVNAGGRSFPSETLSAGIQTDASKGTVMIVNGFDRICAPDDFVAPPPHDTLYAGFLDNLDHGVPYLQDISYIGSMKEFRRDVPWMDDNASGFGDSWGNYETKVVAGNTFDYPSVHGRALLEAGYSFVSCSHESVEAQEVDLTSYDCVDLILGKQKQTKTGRGGYCPLAFKTFTPDMQKTLTAYCRQGGSLLVSGSYVASDLWDNPLAPSLEEDRRFATEVLKYKWRVGRAAREGKAHFVPSPFTMLQGHVRFCQKLNGRCYMVESPDGIEPASEEAHTVMRYSENGISAAVAYQGPYRTLVVGFPLETVRPARARHMMMEQAMQFLTGGKAKKN